MSEILVVLAVILCCCLSASATFYTVGDTAGWDMSTDLDSWSEKKTFYVGDVLWFQYSSSYNVEKVTKESYDVCNTTNILQSSSTGNTTFTLTNPGDEYFICGNKLFCLGGMKLHVHVEKAQSESAVPAPQPTSGGNTDELPPETSKGSDDNPTNSGESNGMVGTHVVTMSFFYLVFVFGVI